MAYDDVAIREEILDQPSEDLNNLPILWEGEKFKDKYVSILEKRGEDGLAEYIYNLTFKDPELDLNESKLKDSLAELIINIRDTSSVLEDELTKLLDLILETKYASINADQDSLKKYNQELDVYLIEVQDEVGKDFTMENLNSIMDKLLIVREYFEN